MEIYKSIRKRVKKSLIDLSKKNSVIRIFLRYLRYIKNKCKYIIYHFSNINKNAIVFESFMGRSYSDNPRAIYEYLLNNDAYKNYKFIWAFKDIDKYKRCVVLNNKRTQIVKYGSQKYYKAYGTSKYWISNSRIPEAIYKKRNQIYIQCWHGTPLKKLGYDIDVEGQNALNSKDDIKKKYCHDAKRYSYMLSSSKFCTEKFVSAFNLKAFEKDDVIIEKGFPRNDLLSNYTNLNVIEVKRTLGIPEDKKVILYAPTWRDDQHDSSMGYVYTNKLDFELLKEKLIESYVILFRAHYFISNSFDFEKYGGFIYNVSDYEDIRELYIISDMLITDYSSVFFDYAILKRPIIFYMYDLEEYDKKTRGFYLPLAELPGEICTNESQLISEICKTQMKSIHYKYNAFMQKYNYLDDGNATERIVSTIFK